MKPRVDSAELLTACLAAVVHLFEPGVDGQHPQLRGEADQVPAYVAGCPLGCEERGPGLDRLAQLGHRPHGEPRGRIQPAT